MSSPSSLVHLSPDRSPSLSSAFPRSSSGETPSTPPAAAGCLPHAPPTPPDSSSRTAPQVPPSPCPDSTPDTSTALSLSSTLSAAAPQFQSRLLDTPIDIHQLAPELNSPAASLDSAADATNRESTCRFLEQGSPTPTQDATSRQGPLAALPPPFVPGTNRNKGEQTPPPPTTITSQTDQSQTKPPNVYINGLPPNFPEEDLLAMTRPFGNVLSVRTFTRHVSDKPSGYGFVLFETLEAAERCIEALRKYRNLHPSFSKQVHKIPGTAYASAPSAPNTGPADSFKARMEQLRDTTSTNLYMEGLPLSITEDTLRALVTPYRIMSSRFFHSRLNHPPRIIAFVRLETRQAAEDIVERLHGRLVRGWNEAGCRISVRFADTPEQRELRRTERHTREDEQSPARLTMARAALLNLKGTQYQSGACSPTLGGLDTATLTSPVTPNLGFMLNGLGSGTLGGQLSPVSRPSPLHAQESFTGGPCGAQDIASLVDSASAFNALNAQAAYVRAPDLHLPQQLVQNGATNGLDEQAQLRLALLSMQGPRSSAQQGYTPVERLILQAHARQRANTLGTTLQNVPDCLQDPRSAVEPRSGSLATGGPDINRRLLECLPTMSEDDFHASATALQGQQCLKPTFSRHGDSAVLGRTRGDSLVPNTEDQQSRQRNHTLAAQVRPELGDQGLHTRSSTLPSPYPGFRSHSHSLSNASIAEYDPSKSTFNSAPVNDGQKFRPYVTNNGARFAINHQHGLQSLTNTSNARRLPFGNNLGAKAQPNTHTLFTSKSNINLTSAGTRPKGQNVVVAPSCVSTLAPQANRTEEDSQHAVLGSKSPQDADADDDGSPVVSPALTYSARTPASLSPATPYSGFFSESAGAFKETLHGTGTAGDSEDALRVGKEAGENREAAVDG
ncbi:hypothetical protein BD414DRAFT_415648 [Trametes punicea]|nr:hypothetical protein BD414DRAFT_415648 [Trametes punicea]